MNTQQAQQYIIGNGNKTTKRFYRKRKMTSVGDTIQTKTALFPFLLSHIDSLASQSGLFGAP